MGGLVPGVVPFVNWTTLVSRIPTSPQDLLGLVGPWRPPQWNANLFGTNPQLYSLTVDDVVTTSASHAITFPSVSSAVASATSPGNVRQTTQSTTYFFDAILRAEHRQDLRYTEHPIQTGAAVVDHAYLIPARLTLEIGMYDSMARFQAGQFTSNSSKSISAFQTLQDLQSRRLPLTVSTRLATYSNLLIASLGAVEDHTKRFAGRFSVTFAQIRLAQTATQTVSARPDQTDLTNEGTKQPLPPDQVIMNSPGLLLP